MSLCTKCAHLCSAHDPCPCCRVQKPLMVPEVEANPTVVGKICPACGQNYFGDLHTCPRVISHG